MPAGPYDESIIEDQIAYYRARAPEYDERRPELNRCGGLASTTFRHSSKP
jgi:hypothetical protein